MAPSAETDLPCIAQNPSVVRGPGWKEDVGLPNAPMIAKDAQRRMRRAVCLAASKSASILPALAQTSDPILPERARSEARTWTGSPAHRTMARSGLGGVSPAASMECSAEQKVRADSIFMGLKFFQDFGRGVQSKLSEIVHVVRLPAGTLIFRQGDPPGNCYMVLSGVLGVFTMTEDEDTESPKAGSPKNGCVSPVSAGSVTTTGRPSVLGMGQRVGGKSYQKNTRVSVTHTISKTFEGFSVCSEETDIGRLLRVQETGALCGELALVNEQNRTASVKCMKDCELLVIFRSDFDNVLKAEMLRKGDEQLRFLMEHMPGMREVAVPKPGTKPHASYYFRKASFTKGHVFLQQGQMAAPAIYLVNRGSVEFLLHHGQPSHASTSSSRLQHNVAASRQSQASPCDCSPPPKATSLKASSKSLAEWRSSLLSLDEPEPATNRLAILMPGGVFGSLPIPVPEPFSVVATTVCEVFFVAGSDTSKLPKKLLDTIREYIALSTAWRLKRHAYCQDFRTIRRARDQGPLRNQHDTSAGSPPPTGQHW